MGHKLPSLRLPIVRYYTVHLHVQTRVPSSFNGNLYVNFAQTEYSQLILSELFLDRSAGAKKTHRINARSHINLNDFETIDKFTIELDQQSYIECVILEYQKLPGDLILADLSEELIEIFELAYLFLKGAIFPGIHKLQMLIEAGLASVVPLRELLSRTLPDKLKINILAEYQLMNFDEKPDDFIDFNLIWFLGKMDLPSVEKYMQEEGLSIEQGDDLDDEGGEYEEEDEDDEDYESFGPLRSEEGESDASNTEPSGRPANAEYERMIKVEFENELKRFYLDEQKFFTRVVGLRHYDVNMGELGEGTRVLLTPEPDNPHDLYAVAVRTREGSMIGYLKKELSEIIYPEIRRGILFRATVVKVLPEVVDSNSRVHLLIEKITYHFN